MKTEPQPPPKAIKKATRTAEKRYHFVLNPYPDAKVSTCPKCGQKTGQRKLPLFIHVNPLNPIVLNYTCRYCAKCDWLIGHQVEIEFLLMQLFTQLAPDVIGNDYLIMGTLDKAVWRENMKTPKMPADIMPDLHPFKSYRTMQRTLAGWFPTGQEPPIEQPPPPEHWIKPEK